MNDDTLKQVIQQISTALRTDLLPQRAELYREEMDADRHIKGTGLCNLVFHPYHPGEETRGGKSYNVSPSLLVVINVQDYITHHLVLSYQTKSPL